ncbi:MAG: magnesium transporter [Pontibacterium sp.]
MQAAPAEETQVLHPSDIALNLTSLPAEERQQLWQSLSSEQQGEVIPYVSESVKQTLLEAMDSEAIRLATSGMEVGDIAEVMELVEDDVAQEIFDSLSEGDQTQLKRSLEFDEDESGRLLDYEGLSVTRHRTAGQVLNHIKKVGMPEYCDLIFLVGKQQSFLGALTLASVLEASEDTPLADIPTIDIDTIDPNLPTSDLARLFRQKYYVSLPVVDSDGRLLGRITLDDAMDVMQEEADHQLMGMAGLPEEEDLFAPVMQSARKRAVWLGINLLTALLASWVIGLFEATLEQVVALAVLMPLVASMGGIAGSQTLTLTIRGLALGQISNSNQRALLRKEMAVGLCNGAFWAVGVAAVAYAWFQDPLLSLVLALAVFVNVLAAAFSGILVPVVLEKLKIDPALAGSVVLTTVTDVVGFFAFLGLGSLWLVG